MSKEKEWLLMMIYKNRREDGKIKNKTGRAVMLCHVCLCPKERAWQLL